MIAAVFMMAIPICIADLSSFKIPNIYNRLISYVAITYSVLFGFAEISRVLTSILLLTLLFLLGAGMGDLKLLASILLTFVLAPVQLIGIILIVATAHIVISTAVFRTIPTKIALAPSIFVGLATYLATRS